MRRARTHNEMSLLFIKAQTLRALSLSLSTSLPSYFTARIPASRLSSSPLPQSITLTLRTCGGARSPDANTSVSTVSRILETLAPVQYWMRLLPIVRHL